MMGYDLESEKCSQNSILFITSWEMESLRAASNINFVRFGFNIIFFSLSRSVNEVRLIDMLAKSNRLTKREGNSS